MRLTRRQRLTLTTAGGVLACGALLAALDGNRPWLPGWLAYSLLLGLSVGLLQGASSTIGRDPRASKAAFVAFTLRLAAGVALTLLLPIYGYDNNQEHQAGYAFTDAYRRDIAAWELAESADPIATAFDGDYVEDQYGGMLALSAAIYRYLSPGVHRPMLVLLVTAAFGALGVPFLWSAIRDWSGERVALPAAWIFAVYPESVLLGSSQMREAYIATGMAIAFYGVTQIRDGRLNRWIWLLAAGVRLFAFSPPAALATFALLSGVWALDPNRRFSWRLGGLFLGLLLIGVLVVVGIFAQYPSLQRAGPWRVLLEWFQYNFGYQSYLFERSSGWVQKLLREAGESWQPVIVLVYGFAQPVLPAHLVVPGIWIVRVIGILRAVGWYLLAPLLIYGLTAILRAPGVERRGQLLWLNLGVFGAILVAALIAGGDQWDNPRYRAWFIAWQALLAAWAWWWARSRGDVWLYRWLLVEGLFVLLFIEWYISRYYRLLQRLNFWVMVALILAASGTILAGGWLRDRRRRMRGP